MLKTDGAKAFVCCGDTLRDVSGGWRWFHARGKVFARNEKGEVTQYMSVNQDITAQEKAKEKPKSRSSLWSKKKA